MAGDEGVATEGVAFKVKAEIQYSSHRIDEIRAHTSVNRIKDRSKIFQDKHDAQSPNVAQKRPTSSPQKAAEIAAKLATPVAVSKGDDGARASLSASKFPLCFYPSFIVFLFQF